MERLKIIIRNYLDAGNLERLFDEAINIVEQDDCDYDFASARLLGRDISKISIPTTKETLIKILQRGVETQEGHRITVNVLQNKAYRSQSYENVENHFNMLLKGLTDHES